MFPELRIPLFARLEDFVGVWSMEPLAFVAMWEAIGRMDLSAHLASPPPDLESRMELVPSRDGRSIAVVPLTGTLMRGQSSMGGTSTVMARRDIRQAVADPNVSGILLAVDSPGGTVAGTYELAQEVRAARNSKPVWAHFDNQMASAAYWIGSQAERITTSDPTSLVGSIGTLLTVYDRSASLEADGVRTLVFKTGPLKGIGVPGAPITEEQAAHLQGIVNATQQHFDEAVRKGRGLSKSELESVRTGGMWMADGGKDLRLIDGIQPLQKTLDQLATAADQPRRKATGLPMLKQPLPMKGH